MKRITKFLVFLMIASSTIQSFAQYGQITATGKAGPRGNFVNNRAVLYDQISNPGTDFAVTAQDFEAANDAFDAEAADEFTVPGGVMWDIDNIQVLGEDAGTTNLANVRIYADNAGAVGTLLFQYLSVAATNDGFGNLDIDIPVTSLSPGDYWLSVQSRLDFGTGGQWFYGRQAPPTIGSEFNWQNPGDGFGSGNTSWVDGSVMWPGNTDYNLSFAINGTSAILTSCTHLLELTDPGFGDGWNGGVISVFVDGVEVLDDVTLGGGYGPVIYPFSADVNSEITTDYVAGGWSSENNYKIFDGTGIMAFESGYPNGTPSDLLAPGVIGICVGTAPVISCPTDAVADSEPGVCGAVVNFADASAIDAEDGALTTTQTAGLPSGSVFPVGVSIVEFSAEDSDGNIRSCEFTVTVTDIENPVAVCQDITIELDASGMATITPADIDGGSTDNCGTPTIDFGGGATVPGSLTTLFGANNGGSPGWTIFFDITVGPTNIDLEALDLNIGESGTAFTLDVYTLVGTYVGNELNAAPWGSPVTSGSGTTAGLDNPSNAVLATPITLSANTTYGFAIVCDHGFEYTNGDGTNEFYSNADMSVSLGASCAGVFSGSLFSPRIFNGTFYYSTIVASTFGSFDCSMVGANLVPLLVTDASGNTDTCNATVTVEDNQAPIIICKGSGGTVTEVETFEGATVPAGWSTVVEVGTQDWAFGSGDLPYVVAAEDFPTNAAIFDDDAAGAGATNFARLVSPVYDLTGVLAAEISFDYYFRQYEAIESLNAEVWDGAAWQEVFYIDTDGPIANSGPIDVIAYANANFQVRFNYDDAGAWGYAAGIDNAAVSYEVAGTPPLEVVLDPTGHVSVDLGDLLVSVDDNCGYTVALGTGGGGGGNACEQSNPSNAFENGLFIDPGTGQLIAADVTVNADEDFTLDQITASLINAPGATMANIDVVYYDDAGGIPGSVIGTESLVPTSETYVGSNFGFDFSDVVLDVTPFIFASQAGIPTTYWIQLVATSSAGGQTGWESTTASINGFGLSFDNNTGSWTTDSTQDVVYTFSGTCGSAATRATVDFDCSNLGENMVDIVVTDDGGNEATCTATVIVLDETAPVIVCGSLLTGSNMVSDSPALAIPDANPAGVTTTIEVIDDFTLTDVNVDVNISHTWRGDLDITITSPAGTVVVLKAADISDSDDDVIVTYDDEGIAGVEALSAFDGENSMGTWTLFVADQFGGDTGTINSWGIAYEYSYPDPSGQVTLQLGPDGTLTIEPEDVLSSVEEACGVDVMLVDITEFSCDDIGAPILVTVFANDTSGNFASCQIEVNIVDLMAPTLTCHGNTTAPFDPATGLYELPDYIATGDTFATDNCTEESMIILTQTPAPGTQLPATGGTPHIISFTAEDEYGNIATCEFELLVDVVGVQENELLANALALYPNPATNLVTLENSSQISLETALIYDLNGKLIAEFDLQEMQRETTLDISNFSSGVFMVKIIGENASTVKRLIKE